MPEQLTPKQLTPHGWPCTLADCPPGPFVAVASGGLGFKTEYGRIAGSDAGNGRVDYCMTNGPDAYCLESGEVFWGGAKSVQDRDDLMVIPLLVEEQP